MNRGRGKAKQSIEKVRKRSKDIHKNWRKYDDNDDAGDLIIF